MLNFIDNDRPKIITNCFANQLHMSGFNSYFSHFETTILNDRVPQLSSVTIMIYHFINDTCKLWSSLHG